MKKRTLIALGLAVSMMASTATAFAGEGGYVINENGQRVWVDDLSTYQPTQPTEGGHYEVNENGQQEWVEGNNTSTETTNPVEESKLETKGNGSTCGTYTKSTVKEYMVSQGNDGTMVTVKEDPEITGSHNGKMYIIVYNDGAREYIRNGKTSHIIEPSTTTEPTTSIGNSGNNENTSGGVTIKDGIAVKPCPSQAELKAYVKAHPFTDNKVNWDKATYKVKPDPANGIMGEVSDKSEQQFLNYLNLARMCAGLPEIILNDEASKEGQCGAAIGYLNGNWSHTPSRPNGLTDTQWETGRVACRYGSLACWSNFKSLVAAEQNLLSEGGYSHTIGHRTAALGDFKQMGVGFVNGSCCVVKISKVFGKYMSASDNSAGIVNNDYFTFPSENFPVEFIQYQQSTFKSNSTSDFPWSIHLGDNYTVSNASDVKVTFNHSRCGSKTISYGTLNKKDEVHVSGKVIYFVPDLGKNSDGDNNCYDIGDKITVTVTGVNKNGSPATIKYTSNLFSVLGYTSTRVEDNEDDPVVEEPTKPSISKPNPAPSVTVKKDATGDKVTTGSGTTSKTYSLTSVSKKYAKLVKTGSATTLTVPDTIKSKKTGKSYKVTSITARVKKNAKLTSLTIGNNVTTIGTAAFYGNKSLKKIVVKGNLTSVGSKAFKGVPKTAKVYVYSTSKTKYNAVVKKLKAAGLTKNSFTYKAK